MPGLFTPALPADVLSRRRQPTLAADGLRLRPWQPRDAEAVLHAFAEADIQRWHLRRIDTQAEAVEWIENWPARWQANTDASWAVTRPEDDSVLGCASLRTLLPFAATAQVSYWTIPAARRQGVAARATRAVTAWGFVGLGLHRVYLIHSVANAASCPVAGRAGFQFEGTLRGYLMHADGWHDVHLHARLATDG